MNLIQRVAARFLLANIPTGDEIALYTLEEYLDLLNPQKKFHPEGGYDFDLFSLNRDFGLSDVGSTGTGLSVEKKKDSFILKNERGRVVGVVHKGTLYRGKWSGRIPSTYIDRYSRDSVSFGIQRIKQVKYPHEAVKLVSDPARRNAHRLRDNPQTKTP